jgi:hypothetical protein
MQILSLTMSCAFIPRDASLLRIHRLYSMGSGRGCRTPWRSVLTPLQQRLLSRVLLRAQRRPWLASHHTADHDRAPQSSSC